MDTLKYDVLAPIRLEDDAEPQFDAPEEEEEIDEEERRRREEAAEDIEPTFEEEDGGLDLSEEEEF